jgi:hypothetical protein
MTRYHVALAESADDADLRQVLRETPMPGRISVAFAREPNFHAAMCVEGRFHQVLAARDRSSGRLVGFGCRHVKSVFVNGLRADVGYLSALRLLPDHRQGTLVARGFQMFRELHQDHRVRIYLTTIADQNRAAIDLLTAGRIGLPTYHPIGRFLTAAVPPGSGRRRSNRSAVEVRAAEDSDLDAIMNFLAAEGPKWQFFPHYTRSDFASATGLLRGLAAGDLLTAWRAGKLAGLLGGWDQSPFRQAIVHGYARHVHRLRPLYNSLARMAGRTPLPPPGSRLRQLTAALPVVAEDRAEETFDALLTAALERVAREQFDFLMVGMFEHDPLWRVVRRRRPTVYVTRAYVACWEDGEQVFRSLDGRLPYLELGSL